MCIKSNIRISDVFCAQNMLMLEKSLCFLFLNLFLLQSQCSGVAPQGGDFIVMEQSRAVAHLV